MRFLWSLGGVWRRLCFFEVEPILGETYTSSGKYQTKATMTVSELRAAWTPFGMLPQLFNDREISVAASASSLVTPEAQESLSEES